MITIHFELGFWQLSGLIFLISVLPMVCFMTVEALRSMR